MIDHIGLVVLVMLIGLHAAFGQTGELRVARRGNQIDTTTGTVKIRAI